MRTHFQTPTPTPTHRRIFVWIHATTLSSINLFKDSKIDISFHHLDSPNLMSCSLTVIKGILLDGTETAKVPFIIGRSSLFVWFINTFDNLSVWKGTFKVPMETLPFLSRYQLGAARKFLQIFAALLATDAMWGMYYHGYHVFVSCRELDNDCQGPAEATPWLGF